MTTDDKKDFKNVVILLCALSLAVFGSMVVQFNIIDLLYLIILIGFTSKYVYIKLKPKPEEKEQI